MPPEIQSCRQFEARIDVLWTVKTELKCSSNIADVGIQPLKPVREMGPE
jgi:hypothetical protein